VKRAYTYLLLLVLVIPLPVCAYQFLAHRRGAFTGTVFSPSDIASIHAWYDAGVGITTNGSGDVTNWSDSVSANDLSQSDSAQMPSFTLSDANFNNEPSVNFDGVDEWMNSSFSSISQPNTIFAVLKVDSTATTDIYLFDGDSGSTRLGMLIHGSGVHWLFVGTTLLSSSSVDTSTHVYGVRYDTTDEMFRDGGTADPSGNAGSHAVAGLTLAARWDESLYLDINFAEFIIYDAALSDSEMNQVGNYLADKYGTSWTDL